MKRALRFLLVVGLIALAAAAGAALYAQRLLAPLDPSGAPKVFEVKRGSALSLVARDLERADLVVDARALVALARWRGEAGKLQAGEYDLSPALSSAEILDRLTRGQVKTYEVVLPEGIRALEIASRLEQAGLTDSESFLSMVNDPEVVAQLGIEGDSLEGYLFPETYQLPRNLPPGELARILVRQFDDVWREIEPKAKAQSLSKREVVTLASIVEKETAAPQERPLIAAVFRNRLERGMRLETDPTVIYGIPDFDGNLKRRHLEDDSNPYNTYRIRGLPPGPIASPGAEALRAVVEPAETDNLYFVSRNDGTHEFSETYADHVNAVNRYQKEETLAMSDDARAFYAVKIPAQFNRALDAQTAAAEGGDDDARRILAGMKAANATIRAIVEGSGDEPDAVFHLNIEAGRMTAGDAPRREPFLTLVHGVDALIALERESGDSALGFLGGLAGLAGEIRLTAQRLDNLADVKGSMRFEMTGDDGFSLITHFGNDPVPGEPNCSISVAADAYADLKSGALAAQDAFLNGKIVVGGDMQMAMQLAFSVMAPD